MSTFINKPLVTNKINYNQQMSSFLLKRPSQSCFESHYESEALCTAFIMKISFHLNANKTNFHMKNFALNFAFVMRFKATRTLPN